MMGLLCVCVCVCVCWGWLNLVSALAPALMFSFTLCHCTTLHRGGERDLNAASAGELAPPDVAARRRQVKESISKYSLFYFLDSILSFFFFPPGLQSRSAPCSICGSQTPLSSWPPSRRYVRSIVWGDIECVREKNSTRGGGLLDGRAEGLLLPGLLRSKHISSKMHR